RRASSVGCVGFVVGERGSAQNPFPCASDAIEATVVSLTLRGTAIGVAADDVSAERTLPSAKIAMAVGRMLPPTRRTTIVAPLAGGIGVHGRGGALHIGSAPPRDNRRTAARISTRARTL